MLEDAAGTARHAQPFRHQRHMDADADEGMPLGLVEIRPVAAGEAAGTVARLQLEPFQDRPLRAPGAQGKGEQPARARVVGEDVCVFAVANRLRRVVLSAELHPLAQQGMAQAQILDAYARHVGHLILPAEAVLG